MCYGLHITNVPHIFDFFLVMKIVILMLVPMWFFGICYCLDFCLWLDFVGVPCVNVFLCECECVRLCACALHKLQSIAAQWNSFVVLFLPLGFTQHSSLKSSVWSFAVTLIEAIFSLHNNIILNLDNSFNSFSCLLLHILLLCESISLQTVKLENQGPPENCLIEARCDKLTSDRKYVVYIALLQFMGLYKHLYERKSQLFWLVFHTIHLPKWWKNIHKKIILTCHMKHRCILFQFLFSSPSLNFSCPRWIHDLITWQIHDNDEIEDFLSRRKRSCIYIQKCYLYSIGIKKWNFIMATYPVENDEQPDVTISSKCSNLKLIQ